MGSNGVQYLRLVWRTTLMSGPKNNPRIDMFKFNSYYFMTVQRPPHVLRLPEFFGRK